MNGELSIVTYIKEFGLAKAIENFKLKCKVYENKILLKYDQIESDMSKSEVQDCRGLILERGTWKVMSLAFRKFFNSAEGSAATIDWNTAYILEKCDGTMIQLYWDWNQERWLVGTSGMAEAEGEVNEKPDTTFARLFWDTISMNCDFSVSRLIKGRTYVFELMTPYNIVVCPHGESKVALLGVRHLESLNELQYSQLESTARDIDIPVVKKFDLNPSNSEDLIATFEGMPFIEEGYVVCDKDFNRIKIKNPAYVAAHHLKSKTGAHHILTIVKANEIDEYGATFPERLEEINTLKIKYDELIVTLENVWEGLKEFLPKDETSEEQKRYAFKVFDVVKENDLGAFKGMFFGLKDDKVDSVKTFIANHDNKRLYSLFTN